MYLDEAMKKLDSQFEEMAANGHVGKMSARERAIKELQQLDFRLRHLPPGSPSRPKLEERRENLIGALEHDEEMMRLSIG